MEVLLQHYRNCLPRPGISWEAMECLVGARFFRGDDIHIADHFYFDDHSSQGFGVRRNRTQFSVMFPAAVDTNSSYLHIFT
jgi:hypothetical protein